MGRIKDLLAGLAALLGVSIWLVVAVGSALSLPFNMLVAMRWFGVEWWTAMLCVVLMMAIPLIGAIAYVVFTFLGAFYLYQADFDWRKAITPSTETFYSSELSSEQFAEYARTVLRPKLRDVCIDGTKQDMVSAPVPQFCDCIARTTFEVVTQKEWVEIEHKGGAFAGLATASPAFKEKLKNAYQAQCWPKADEERVPARPF